MACAGRGLSWRTCRDLLSSSADWSAPAFRPWSRRRPRVTVGMGLDQQRAAATGEVVGPATGAGWRGPNRAAPARVADGRPIAGIVDPARAPARPARPGAASAHAGRCAPRVAAADAGGALSPRRPIPQLADDRGVARVAGAARTAGDGARAD